MPPRAISTPAGRTAPSSYQRRRKRDQALPAAVFKNFAHFFLLGRNGSAVGVLQDGKLCRQGLALFGVRAPIEAFRVHPARHIARRLCRVDAEHTAEAGLLRLGASHRHDGRAATAALIVGVRRLREKHAVENVKAPAVTGAYAEQHERRRFVARLDQIDLLAGDLEAHQIFNLREEEVLGAAHRIERAGKRRSLLPDGEIRLFSLTIGRDIERLLRGNGGKEPVQLRSCNFFSCLRASSLVYDGRLTVVLAEVHQRRPGIKNRLRPDRRRTARSSP